MVLHNDNESSVSLVIVFALCIIKYTQERDSDKMLKFILNDSYFKECHISYSAQDLFCGGVDRGSVIILFNCMFLLFSSVLWCPLRSQKIMMFGSSYFSHIASEVFRVRRLPLMAQKLCCVCLYSNLFCRKLISRFGGFVDRIYLIDLGIKNTKDTDKSASPRNW